MTEENIRLFITIFISILYEALPFIVLGALVAGLLEELVPQTLVARLLPRSRVLAILIGGLLGLLFPMCECGIIPVMRRLLRKGVPLSSCVCYMLAGPIINVVVMLSTWVAFSGADAKNDQPGAMPQLGSLGMTSLRMGLGYLVAIGTSMVVEWQYRKHGNKLLAPMAIPNVLKELDVEDTGPRGTLWERFTGLLASVRRDLVEAGKGRTLRQRLNNISETALHDFVDITVFLILGAILASATRLVLKQEMINHLAANFPLVILIMMGVAILLCLCSEADAFVAASFSMLPPSSKLAFLVLGPMLDFKLYMMYTRVFRPRLIWTIILCVVVQVYVYSLLMHVLMQEFPGLFFWPGTAG